MLEGLWHAPKTLLDAIDEAIRARLVAGLPETIGRFRFAHGLIQETLYDRVSSRRRADLHRRIDRECRAEVLLGDSAAARESFDHAASLARDLGDHERLARAALGYADAGFEFARSKTMGVARPVEQRAIALLEEAFTGIHEADRSPLRVRLLGRLARELHRPESRARRLALSESALHLAHRLDDPICLAETVTVRREVLCEPENLHDRLGDLPADLPPQNSTRKKAPRPASTFFVVNGLRPSSLATMSAATSPSTCQRTARTRAAARAGR